MSEGTAWSKQIYRLMTERLSEEDLRSICFFARTEYDDLRAVGRSAKMRELILEMQRKNAVDILLQNIIEVRPDLEEDLAAIDCENDGYHGYLETAIRTTLP